MLTFSLLLTLRLIGINDGLAKVILGEVVVMLAHVCHEFTIHAQDHQHLELLVIE